MLSRIIPERIVRDVEPRKLLRELMHRAGDNPYSLARKLESAGVKQPQLHKFLAGTSREPRRATLKPVADYYNIPLDAFYDIDVAADVAKRLGMTEGPVRAKEEAPGPAPIPIDHGTKWPFKSVTLRRFQALSTEAKADIEAHLEFLVEKWEKAATPRKRRPS